MSSPHPLLPHRAVFHRPEEGSGSGGAENALMPMASSEDEQSLRCRKEEGRLLQRRAGNGVLKPEIGYYETRNTRRGRTASSEDAG